MKIYLGGDHAGFELKAKVKKFLNESASDYEVEDCCEFSNNPDDDYPDFIKPVALALQKDPHGMGIIFGGSGQGEAMVANRYKGVRATVFYAPAIAQGEVDVSGRRSNDPFEIVRLSREHNNTNVLSLSARFLKESDALKAVELWLKTPFPKEERHVRRLNK